jgi:2-(1,2-epoxy-1,2-dihydrophenyl)acetyl-CoA isomerase
MTEPLVTLEVTKNAAVIRLNRPARHNALVPALLEDLLDALRDERSRNARTVILAAEGRSFSTGGDLLEFWQHRDNIADYAQKLVGLLNQAVIALWMHPSPVVCAVQGQVTGGSLGLLLAADRVIMMRGVTITPWYSEVGFSPDGGWTALLPGVIGRQRSFDWLCSNASVTAEECLDMGIAHELVAKDAFAAALAWAERIAGMNQESIESTRSLLGRKTDELRQRLEAERAAFVRQVQTPGALEGIARFLGKKTF